MATRYSYPIDLHEEREGGYSVTFPDFDEAFTDGDHACRGGRGSRRLSGGGPRRAHRAARGHSGAEPGQGPARGGSRRGPGRQGGVLRGPARRTVVQQCLRGGHGDSGKRGPPHARPPATPPRSAGWRKPWPALRSAWWSPWRNPPDRRWVPAGVSIFLRQLSLYPMPGRGDVSGTTESKWRAFLR